MADSDLHCSPPPLPRFHRGRGVLKRYMAPGEIKNILECFIIKFDTSTTGYLLTVTIVKSRVSVCH